MKKILDPILAFFVLSTMSVAMGQDYASQLAKQARMRGEVNLAAFGPDSWPILIEYACGTDQLLREMGGWVLLRSLPASFPCLVEMYRDGDGPRRDAIARLLASLRASVVYSVPDIWIKQRNEVIPLLEKSLAKEDVTVQRFAAFTLAELKPAAAVAIPVLTASLKVDDPILKRLSARALGMVGEAAASAVPDLVAILDDQDGSVRSEAAEALGKMGAKAEAAAPELARVATDPNRRERIDKNDPSINALAKIGPSGIVALANALKDPKRSRRAAQIIFQLEPDMAKPVATPPAVSAMSRDAEISRAATVALARLDPTHANVGGLIDALKDGDQEVRTWAVIVLGQLGRRSNPAKGPLIALLKDQKDNARRFVAGTLSRIDPEDETTIHAIGDALVKDPDTGFRVEYASVLGGLGRKAGAALPALFEALNDRYSYRVPLDALRAIEAFGSDVKPPLPALVKALWNRSADDVCRYVIKMIEPTAPGAKEFIPPLINFYIHDWTNNNLAKELLVKFGSAAVPGLIKAWGDADKSLYGDPEIAAILIEMGPVGVTALADLLKDPKRARRAALALVGMGDAARPMVPALAVALNSPDVRVARAATAAMVRTDPERVSVAALSDAIKDDDIRETVISALEARGPSARAAIPALEKALNDPDHIVTRLRTASALAKIDPKGEAAPRALIELLPNEDYYRTAQQLLRQLDPSGSHLIIALGDQRQEIRRHAIYSLRNIGVASEAIPSLIDAMIDALKHPDAEVRRVAAVILARYDVEARSTSALALALKDKSVRSEAAEALAAHAPASRAAIPDLLDALEDKDPSVRRKVAIALGRMGPAAKIAVPALARARTTPREGTLPPRSTWP